MREADVEASQGVQQQLQQAKETKGPSTLSPLQNTQAS